MIERNIFVGLGANLGDRIATLRRAIEMMDRIPATRCLRVSSFYETAPVGGVPQGAYVNAVCRVESELVPAAFLRVLDAIETALGRDRSREVRWGPRAIDLDVLFWGSARLSGEGLAIPHPRAHERAFVLVPMAELDPAFVHPSLGRTVADLLAAVGRAGVEALP